MRQTFKEGTSDLNHLLWIEKKAKKTDPRLKLDRSPPRYLEYWWDIFKELHSVRQVNNGYPVPITYSELYYYSKINTLELDAEDIEIIMSIDSVYVNKTIQCIAANREK